LKLHVLFQKVIKSFYFSSSILKSLSPNQVITKVKTETEKETKEVYVFLWKINLFTNFRHFLYYTNNT